MSITIAEPAIEERVQRLVDSGRFADATEVVGRALDVMESAEKRLRLRELVAEGLEDIENGDVYDWTPTLIDEIWAEAEEEDRLNLPIPDHVKP